MFSGSGVFARNPDSLAQAQQAWEHVVSQSGPRKITTRHVQSPVNALGLKPAAEPAAKPARASRADP